MKTIFVAWQNQVDRKWIPVGKLTYDGKLYSFTYTQGALLAKNFVPFGRMADLSSTYTADELFPLFSNRLLTKSRPEYSDLLKWMNVKDNEYLPMDMLALTEGRRGTDTLEMFPCPEKIGTEYVMNFFVHGIRHLPEIAQRELHRLTEGDSLFLLPDIQNSFDEFAILLRTNDPVSIVGYCPRYLAKDFYNILHNVSPKLISINIVQINNEAPLQFKLLCSFNSPWPDSFKPCSDSTFQPISQD